MRFVASSGPRPARRGHGGGACGGPLASSARQDERYSGRVTFRFALSLYTITSADACAPAFHADTPAADRDARERSRRNCRPLEAFFRVAEGWWPARPRDEREFACPRE